jgi:hypothetical protein
MDIPPASSFAVAAFRTISTQTSTDWEGWLNHPGPIPVAAHIAGEHIALTLDPDWLRSCGAAFDTVQKTLAAHALNAFRGEIPITEVQLDSHTSSGRFTLPGPDGERHAIAYTYAIDDGAAGHHNEARIASIAITDARGETLAALQDFFEGDLLAQPEESIALHDELLDLILAQRRYDSQHRRDMTLHENPLAAIPESVATLEAITQYVTEIFACAFLGPIVMWDPSLTEVWRPFKDETGASHFSAFMDSLSQTVNVLQDASFRPEVVAFLWHLTMHASLRQICFGISEQATTSCEDRVSLAFNMMQSARLVADIEAGGYDNAPETVIANIRQIFRTEMLNGIAYDKYKSLPSAPDKTQIDLAYQVQLRDRLQLRFGVKAMKFSAVGLTHVTGNDLDRAEHTVKKSEIALFPRYLSNNPLWQAFLTRWNGRRYDAVKAALGEALTKAPFAEALQQRLQGFGCTLKDGGPHTEFGIAALVQAGREITQDVTHEHIGQLTAEYLNSRNLSALLTSPWAIQTGSPIAPAPQPESG